MSTFDVHANSREATELEEREAVDRQTNYNRIMFNQIVRDLRSSLDTMKEENTCDPEARKKICMLVLDLKKLNRFDKLQNRHIRDSVMASRSKVDTLHLQLENLLYETTCLEKEITKCREFKSKVSEIDLIPLEQFVSSLSPDKVPNDDHQLTLARLENELEQRKHLADELKNAELTREKCFEKVEAEKAKLEKVHPKLKNIVDVCSSTRDLLTETVNSS